MTPVHLEIKRSFWLLRALGAIAFSAVCLWTLLRGGLGSAGGLLGLIGLILFGTGAIVGLVAGTRRGPRITIDDQGVNDRSLKVGVIPWSDILGAELYGSAASPFIALYLRDPAPYLARSSAKRRIFARLNSGSGLPPFSINLVGVDADPVQVERLILSRSQLREPPRGG
jgi:hypothetical protein